MTMHTSGLALIIVGTVITAAFSLGIGLVMRKLNKKDKKDASMERQRKYREEEQEKKRKTRDVLILKGLDANYHATKELIPCVRGTKEPNGELTNAEKWMDTTNHEIDDFLRLEGVK